MIFDTHAHYDDKQFDADRDALLRAMPDGGIVGVVNQGTTLESSLASVRLAETYPFIYAAAGIHPEEMDDFTPQSLAGIEKLLDHPRVVAVGEIGLDYHWRSDNKELQKQALRVQLELARAKKMPAVIHERDACADTLEILEDYPDVLIDMHCFAGSWETAKHLLDRGRYLSFGGVVTFKNARRAVEVVQKMPPDRLMLETDCPYMAPVPHRGKRNSSLLLPFVSARIAELRGVSQEEIEELTTANACRFFGLSLEK